ncbi:Pycsar system effector family protein [Chondrinema litorale]|uniref:Pycsar system effector family protein n=1 Tax=Chondrinema litorale TaxID=2994555 RepID=UPI0025434C1B|nr:Pycsar system effector family protein [Chondrinema litorale]UZR92924.1 DUF5706 domain-containing protein [Chondrinema litorale]
MEQTKQSILESVESYVKHFLKERLPQNKEYHDSEHTMRVAQAAKEIGIAEGLTTEELEILQIAAWFHDTGHIETESGHEEISAKMAGKFLKEHAFPEQKIKKVKDAIRATKMPQSPKNKLEKVLCDADLSHLGSNEFFEVSASLRRELHSLREEDLSDEDWIKKDLEFLKQHEYFTEYGRTTYSERKKKNLKKLEKKLKKLDKEKDEALLKELNVDETELKQLKKKLQKVEGRPERGIETMFRTTSKNHVDFSSMADSKANIMISVNSIIITIIVGVLMRKLDNNPHLIAPTIILLIVCLASIVFAILATRPNITSGRFSKDDIKQKKANLLFFGNFHKMQLSDFEWGMKEMINDSDYLYGSMIKDIYFLGVVLGRKYRYLRTAYTIFMFGLIISSIAFIIATFTYDGATSPLDLLNDDTF